MKREHLHQSITNVLEPIVQQVKVKKNLPARLLDGAMRPFNRKPRSLNTNALPGFKQVGELPNIVNNRDSQKARILTVTALIAANMFALILFGLLLYIL
ncbi:MAG: hypothetical protein K0S09_3138 [Sphingobacteriaceae bacterium]|jgi:hypothetical protein|nr:hypothetical protein [Sphingobacteriaceae bacterium]